MDQSSTTNRNPYWDDDAPAEPRARRGQESSARAGRKPATEDQVQAEAEPSGDQDWEERVSSRNASRVERRAEPAAQSDGVRMRWWRPESGWGRALLALGACLVVGGGMVAALMLRNALESDDRFRITGASNIESEGLSEVSRAELLPAFGEDIGKNIFFIHLEQRRRDIEAIPWVKHATVMRMLPNHLRVHVVERVPVAFTQINGEMGLVDADGVLLSMSAATMAERHYSFPDVTGVGPALKRDDRHARMNVYMQMMSELDAGGQRNSLQISEVDLSDPNDARVKMVDQSADIVVHLGDERFLERYQRYMRHIAEWRQQHPRLIGVDLRYKDQVVLKSAPAGMAMPGEAATQQAAASQSPRPGQQTGQSATAKASASAVAVPVRQQVAGKSAAKGTESKHGTAAQKNAPVHGANAHTGRAKAEKLKAEQARRVRIERQRKQELARRAQLNTARHKVPVLQTAQPAVEGQ